MDITIKCPCPGTPHESDTVTLFDVLDFTQVQSIISSAQMVQNDDPEARGAEVNAKVKQGYLLFGIERWTLRDGSKKIEPTKANIRQYILADGNIYPPLLRAADDLYPKAVLLPLGLTESDSSPTSQTTGSTSPSRGRGTGKRGTRSSRSSISTIPTGDTAETSSPPDGAYSSSQSLELAG